MGKVKLQIFKIGGKVVEDEKQLTPFLESFSKLQGNKILVHGGGKWVTEMSQKLGIEVKMIDGRRITSAETLEVVKMMLAGVASKNIVSKLQAFGCNAIGMTGADGNTILADRRPPRNGIDYGFVGDIRQVNATVIGQLISSGLVPVFTAMTHDGKGQLLNTNADTIASSLGVAMAQSYEVELNYCFELDGVLEDIDNPGSVIRQINSAKYRQFKSEGIINLGMIPKIDNAFDALNAGVSAVRILNSGRIQELADGYDQVGTLIIK